MDADIIHDSIEQYYKTKHPDVETVHVLVDQHWPIKYAQQRKDLELIAKKFNCQLLDPGKNLGLHDGFNWAWSQHSIPGNAMVIGYDPDSWPLDRGWDMAMCKLFVAKPSIEWLSLWHTHCDRQLVQEGSGGTPFQLDGVKAMPLLRPAMNSICGFRQEWLCKVGGLWEGNQFYGGLECGMWDKISQGSWVFLPEYREDLRMHDRMRNEYRDYKWYHAHVRSFPGDFESYLREKHPELIS